MNFRNPNQIIKQIGTSSILSESNLKLRLGLLSNLVEICNRLRIEGHKIILVSSGAIGMGMRRMLSLQDDHELHSSQPQPQSQHSKWSKKPKSLNEKQALAAIGQGYLIGLWDSLFSQLNQPIAQILLTRSDLADRSRYLNASSTINTLLNHGVIPIINENDTLSITEIKFGDNDTLSAVTAGMCKADYLFLMTDVNCLFTENPRKNPKAQIVRVVHDVEGVRQLVSTTTLGSSLGTGGMETKLIAAELATLAGVSTIICNSLKPESIPKILAHLQSHQSSWFDADGLPLQSPAILSSPDLIKTVSMDEPIYTVFLPVRSPLTDRKFWVAYGLAPKGSVVIDEGAFKALSRQSNGGRLLPVGLSQVFGRFSVGQAVKILIPKEFTDHSRSIEEERMKNASELNLKSLSIREDRLELDFLEVGRGLANYNSIEMFKVKGLHSNEIENVLDHIDSEHVIESIVMMKLYKS
ncbi:Aspartate/glutamate/uridylate kinase [Melampsora americana]|nr:Aspartate/glutamate/uridylate kinase [Melampsora americana]